MSQKARRDICRKISTEELVKNADYCVTLTIPLLRVNAVWRSWFMIWLWSTMAIVFYSFHEINNVPDIETKPNLTLIAFISWNAPENMKHHILLTS